MKKVIKYFLRTLFLIFIMCYAWSCRNADQKNENHNPQFEKEMIKALNLHWVETSDLYSNSWLRIFNDTVVGYRPVSNPDSCVYFIQSLKNTAYKKYIHVNQLITCDHCGVCSSCVSAIDCFRDGCIYSGKYGDGYVVRASSDGTISNLFTGYRNTLFYANKILLYKNRVVVTSYNGVYIFDMSTEKLLWKYKYELNNGLSSIVNDKLIFTYTDEKSKDRLKTIVVCVNIDELMVLWKKEFNGFAQGAGTLSNELAYYSNKIIVAADSLSVLNLKSGATEWQYKPYGNKLWSYKVFIDSSHLYFSSALTSQCYNIPGYTKVWQDSASYIDIIYKDNIVAQDSHKQYLIIDKRTGQVLKKIKDPYNNEINIQFIDKCFLFNRKNLYE